MNRRRQLLESFVGRRVFTSADARAPAAMPAMAERLLGWDAVGIPRDVACNAWHEIDDGPLADDGSLGFTGEAARGGSVQHALIALCDFTRRAT